MTATIRVGYAGPLVTGSTPAVGINAPVTVGALVAATFSAAIAAPVKVSAPGLGPQVRVAWAGPLLTDVPYAVAIQAPVAVGAALTGGPSGGVIRIAYAGPLFTVQDTHYWSGTAWVDGVMSAFIQAPVTVTAAGFTPAPAVAIRIPVAVGAAMGLQRDIDIDATLELDVYAVTLDLAPYTVTLEDTVPRTIRTSIGDAAYVSLLVVETTGKDITASTFQISLGTPNGPGAWLAPTVVETVNAYTVRLKLLVGTGGVSVASSTYRPWGRIIDFPETESVLCDQLVNII